METKQIIPVMLLDNDGTIGWEMYDPKCIAVHMDECHADGLFIRDMNKPCREQEESLIKLVKGISASADIALYVGESYARFENVKKIIYAGAAKAVVSYRQDTDGGNEQESSSLLSVLLRRLPTVSANRWLSVLKMKLKARRKFLEYYPSLVCDTYL